MKNNIYNLIIAVLLLFIGATAKDLYKSYLLPVNNEMSSIYIMIKDKPTYVGELKQITTIPTDSNSLTLTLSVNNDNRRIQE